VILAVDDTPGNLVALEAVLERDFELRLARSGAEAIAQLEHRADADIILMDVNMPVMDGYETANRITHIPGCGDIPIVFITATYKEDPYIKRGYEAGGIDYFTKPFDPDLLRKKMGVYASFRQRAAVLAERERQVQDAQELLAATKRLSSTLHHSAIGVVITDLGGSLLQANDVVEKLVGSGTHDALVAWWAGDAHSVRDHDQALARALRHGETSTLVARLRRADGTSLDVQSCISALRAADGTIIAGVVTLSDLTEPSKLERELETRTEHLISQERARLART